MNMSADSKKRIAILCWEAGCVPRGLMQLETLIGNSTNLATYSYGVRICRIKGANLQTVLENPSEEILQRMIDESRKLVQEGVWAITTSCGFNAIFQSRLNKEIEVPVFTSSLLQVPYVNSILPHGKKIAIMTAKKAALRREHLEQSGIVPSIPVEIIGLESCKVWSRIFSHPDLDFDLDAVSDEVVGAAVNAVGRDPSIGAFVQECTDLPPFSQLIRERTSRPVFDFQTMMNHIASSLGLTDTNETHKEVG